MKTGDTVTNIIRCLDLPTEQIKLIFINGRHGDTKTVLQEGDRVVANYVFRLLQVQLSVPAFWPWGR
jgi:hypothetical protein